MNISKLSGLLLIVFLLSNGCAGRFPGEVVELSATVGEDIKALHLSYRALIETHFNSLRQQTESFIKNRWLPVFIEDFMERGNLVQMAQTGQSDRVSEWVEVAMETVMDKRNRLIKPIDEEEEKLLEMVDNSFALLTRANDKISSHLKSRSRETGLLEGVLNIDDLGGLRKKINHGLTAASQRVAGITDRQEKSGEPAETAAAVKDENKEAKDKGESNR